ncbi:glycosyltransferase, partial [Janibacter hoylei]|uniref:glycosyltransferase n=1 Tax=Janibacter hoylei TaxID=364298 RepID=UPI00248FBC54
RFAQEALAMGCPIIAYSDGSAGEILNHYFPDGLVDRGDMEGLLAASLSLNSRLGAINPQEFSYAVSAEKTIDYFRDLLN